eukprot:scaffold99669_cov21-Prasinocladus_malaysianus.AAC.1
MELPPVVNIITDLRLGVMRWGCYLLPARVRRRAGGAMMCPLLNSSHETVSSRRACAPQGTRYSHGLETPPSIVQM